MRRSSDRTRTSPSSSRDARSRSSRSRSHSPRRARRPKLEEMGRMLGDAYEKAAASDKVKQVKHFESLEPPTREIFLYKPDPTKTKRQVYLIQRYLRRKKKEWEKFLELYPDTLRDDPNLSRADEQERRLHLIKAKKHEPK